jgi:hypothetical protein
MSTNQPTYDVTEFEVYVDILLLSLDSLGAHFARIGLDRVSPEPVQTSARICLEWLSQSPRRRQKSDLVIDKMVELLRQCQSSDFSSQVAAWLRSFVRLQQIEHIASAWGAVLLQVDDHHLATLRQLGLRDDSIDALRSVSNDFGDDACAIEDFGNEYDQSVVTPWDRARFEEYRKESDLVSPIDYLASYLRTAALVKAFDSFGETTKPARVKNIQLVGTNNRGD